MRAHAEGAFPEECVGALLSDGQVRPLKNVAVDRRSTFCICAADHLALEAEAETKGVVVTGFYHSHPDGPAAPSLADAKHASSTYWTLIIPVPGGVASAPRVFRFEDERFIEVEVEGALP